MLTKKFEKDIAAFSFAQLQNAIQLFETLRQTGYTLTDLSSYIKAKQKAQKESSRKQRVSQQCPECSALMLLLPINDRPETQTGDDSKSVWLCQNKRCMHTIYNSQTIEKLKEALPQGGT